MDGTHLKVSSTELAAQLRQERNSALKRLRQARTEAVAKRADSRENTRIRRELEAEEREADMQLRKLSKFVLVKPERVARPARRKPSRQKFSGASSARSLARPKPQATSALARRDNEGREGIMLKISYVRAGGKHAGPNCLRRHFQYIAREAAVSLDSEGRPIILSNLGDSIEEVCEGLALQESILRAMRKNAKLGSHIILAIPYGFPVDAWRELLQRLGDALFGSRDLPWSGAVHDADPEAEADNPHLHLDYAMLPILAMGDGTFLVGNDLRTDLDGKDGLRFIRHMAAEIMTEVAQDFGLERKFTGLSYRERGMAREGGEHVGQAGTAAHRRGEYVAAIARNEARRERDDAKEKLAKARRRAHALEQLKRSLDLAAPYVATMSEIPVLTDLGNEAPTLPIEPVHDAASWGGGLPAAPGIDAFSSSLAGIGEFAPIKPQPPVEILTNEPILGPVMMAPPSLFVVHAPIETEAMPETADRSAIGLAPEVTVFFDIGATPLPPAAPVLSSAPLLTDIGERFAPGLPPIPRLFALGSPAPQIEPATFKLWSIGPKITRDPKDEAVTARLIGIVERERQRRHEAATAKPLDPFDQTGKTIRDRDFEELLIALEENPALLVVDEGEIYPGEGLPGHLRKAMHGYAAYPRARARMLNVVDKAKAESSKIAPDENTGNKRGHSSDGSTGLKRGHSC